ncbi:uncharacterized protein LOC111030905 isoform X2 [Myzus persicae]|uniref:uncharacterized protein LOC111030905 isoform X2 n=1 Tax=Myzus persicae TaxID=13164 RepID=UPI000B934246|nr:uncharacterized protein LOC111030905 isoform X2 [Myzus persicae]
MPRKCSVNGCTGLSEGKKNTLFKRPKDVSGLNAWNEAISNANGQNCFATFVCEKHFRNEDIIYEYANHPNNMNGEMKRTIPQLRRGAVPSIFSSYIGEPLVIKKNRPSCSKQLIWKDIPATISVNDVSEAIQKCEHVPEVNTFDNLLNVYKHLKLPMVWLSYGNVKAVTFYLLRHTFNGEQLIATIEKQITFTSEHEIGFYIMNNYPINYNNLGLGYKLAFPLNEKNIVESIEHFNNKIVCCGGPHASNFSGIQIKTATLGFNNIWRHVKCSMIIDSNKRCKFCEGLYSTFRVYKKRSLEAKSKYIGPILTPNRKKKYCDILKKKKIYKNQILDCD